MKHVYSSFGAAFVACLAVGDFCYAQLAAAPVPIQFMERGCVVTFLAFSDDGKTLAYGLWPYPDQPATGAAVVWDRAAGKQIQRIEGKVGNGAMSADAKTLALWIDGGPVSLFDVATGKMTHECEDSKKGNCPSQFAFLPDGKTLAGSFWNRQNEGIHLWDAATGKLLRRVGDARGYAEFFAVSRDGNKILAGHETRRLVKFDPKVHIIRPKGDTIVETESAVCLWDVATGKELWGMAGLYYPPRNRGAWGLISSTGGGLEHGFRVRVAADGHPFFTPAQKKLPFMLNVNVNGVEGIVLADLAGKKIRSLPELDKRPVETAVFSPDGRSLGLLAANVGGLEGTKGVVYDLSDLLEKEKAGAAKLSAMEMDGLWSDLAGPEDRQAHRAMFTLGLMPDAAFVKFMKDRVPTIAPPDARRITRLIGDLDSSAFAVRDKAMAELQKLGSQEVAGALRVALKGKLAVEQKRRLEQILDKVITNPFSGETQRGLRVIDLLEQRNLPQARTLLEVLARGTPGAWVTEEAKAAVRR